MQLATRQTRISIGAQSLQVECLENLDRAIDSLFEELDKTGNASLLEDLCPYFGTIWPSAVALAEALTKRANQIRGKTVLELGCGLALPSLIASRLGAQVIATDFHPEVPKFLEKNQRLNDLQGIEYVEADWRNHELSFGPFDCVIGSDILYEKQHSAQLAQMIHRHLSDQGHAIITDPARPYLQAFVEEMKALGFRVDDMEVQRTPDHPEPKEVFILSLSRQ